MSDYSGLPDEPDGHSRFGGIGCGLGCIGLLIGAAGFLAIVIWVAWGVSTAGD